MASETRRWSGVRTLALAAAVVTAAATGVLLVKSRTESSGLDRARAILRSDSEFGGGAEAATAMATVGSQLLEDAESCARRLGASAPLCNALFSASARAQVLAVELLTCGLPDVFETRRQMRVHLEAIAALGENAGHAELPRQPAVPSC